jgi:hypothetical protein
MQGAYGHAQGTAPAGDKDEHSRLEADLMLAFAASPLMVFVGAALWGLHMAFTQGLLSKLVADTAPAERPRHGFRDIQSCEWRCAAVSECDCGLSLEFSRGVSHVCGWCSLCSRDGHRVASRRTASQSRPAR